MATVTAFRNLDELESLRLIWNALLVESQDVSWFQTLDWYCFSMRELGHGWKPLVLLVESADRNVGILPLAIATSSSSLGKVRELVAPPMPNGALFRPIGRSITATLITAARFLERHPLWWDVAKLQGIDRNGWDRGRMEDSFANAGMRLQSNGNLMITRWNLAEPPASIDVANETKTPIGSSDLLYRDFDWHHIRPDAAHYGDGDPDWESFHRLVGDVKWDEFEFIMDAGIDSEHPNSNLEKLHAFAAERGTCDLLVQVENEQPIGFLYHVVFNGFAVQIAHGRMVTRESGAPVSPELLASSEKRWRMLQATAKHRLKESGVRLLETPDEGNAVQAMNATTIHRMSYRGYARSSNKIRLLRILHWLKPKQAS